MPHSRLHKLHAAGQSVWLDYIDRTILADGALTRQIADDALTGMTSNPTIFEKALATGTAYDAQLAAAPESLTPWQLFELVESDDVRTRRDQFRSVYEQSGGTDATSRSKCHRTSPTTPMPPWKRHIASGSW